MKAECLTNESITAHLNRVGTLKMSVSSKGRTHYWVMSFTVDSDIRIKPETLETKIRHLPGFVGCDWQGWSGQFLLTFGTEPSYSTVMETVFRFATAFNLDCSAVTIEKEPFEHCSSIEATTPV